MRAIDALKRDFRHNTRHNGQDYFNQKRVHLTKTQPGRVEADVRGSSRYHVHLEWDDQDYSYNCTCPFFTDHYEPCKHIWATILEADARRLFPDDESEEFADEDNLELPPGTEYESIDLGEGRTLTLLRPSAGKPAGPMPPPQRHAVWRRRLTEIRAQSQSSVAPAPWPAERQIIYVIDAPSTIENPSAGICIDLCSSKMATPPARGPRPKRLRLAFGQIALLPDPADRQLISMLAGLGRRDFESYYSVRDVPTRYRLPDHGHNDIIRQMCLTGRCRLRTEIDQPDPAKITWDDGPAWQLHLSITPHDKDNDGAKTYRLQGALIRGNQRVDIAKPALLVPGGPVFFDSTAAALQDNGAFAFVPLLRREQQIVVPAEQADELLSELLNFPSLPELELHDSIAVTQLRAKPRARLRFSRPEPQSPDRLSCRLTFEYGSQSVPHSDPRSAIFEPPTRQLIHRDMAFERKAIARLIDLGFREFQEYPNPQREFRLPARRLPLAVRALTTENWLVEVDGKIYRQPGKIRIEVRSGIDWFELDGSASFDDHSVPVPALLRAIARNETTVLLDDGTLGILPEEWLQQYRLVAAIGEVDENSVKFSKSQAGILDALLSQIPDVAADEAFAKARRQLAHFEGVRAADASAEFVGTLRPYQRDGLGWLHFLRTFGMGGCLADDMGLGKTIQVLALLDQRRLDRLKNNSAAQPSLVVVPRSLVFNWRQEAARFTPALRVLDHATADRLKTTGHFKDFDLILTTYGTLRNDLTALRDVQFDYVILDEAQAVKNAASESAKAARLLRCDHRLALSGTPVQNHLGELWSLFEFLNPGMLGASRAFSNVATGRIVDAETRTLLSTALRPFILRRTKRQVAPELPEKFEETLFCELDKAQRALYDELKEHYRQSLMTKIATEGMGKSKIQILEALLRLRQAACHPGLLDKSRLPQPSAKLEALLPRLDEVVEEGNKAIVFSQFTSFLAIVRKRLDEQGVAYEYLDGKTRDRQQKVDRFQTDDKCRLFLVSLKAGGVGLNLTAAQYVFLLDPWWNPAVEAQAIDRAHRIGQTETVFAYRLIARDTVEEKVLQLQQTKRDLADAIINADNALISRLAKEDLELLLS